MRIENSQIQLASYHSYKEEKRELESLHVWGEKGMELGDIPLDDLEITANSVQMFNQSQVNVEHTSVISPDEFDEESYLKPEDRLKIAIIEDMVTLLTGKSFKFKLPKLNLKHHSGEYDKKGKVKNEGQGWGMIYHHETSYHEKETMDFNAKGVVKTADGKEIDIDIQMHLNREYYEANKTEIRGGDALIDPLVLNFEGNAATLNQSKFEFDLDLDGNPDQISYLNSGSGFLVLDQNENGIVDSGKELFGPESGNGFQELAEYDSDGNGWIDEADPIFSQLRIWMKQEGAHDQLIGLGEVGVGAIYLGHASTNFQIKDFNNELHGQIRESGIYLNENGTAGTIQEIDLKI